MSEAIVNRRCNVWDMREGERCIIRGRIWVRCPNIRNQMPGVGMVDNAVLRAAENKKERQLFLRGIEVDVIESGGQK